jgi:hypothetical protein
MQKSRMQATHKYKKEKRVFKKNCDQLKNGTILRILSLSFLECNVIFFDYIASLTDESPELLLAPVLQQLAGNVAGNIFRPEQSFNQSSLAAFDQLPAAISSISDIQQ